MALLAMLTIAPAMAEDAPLLIMPPVAGQAAVAQAEAQQPATSLQVQAPIELQPKQENTVAAQPQPLPPKAEPVVAPKPAAPAQAAIPNVIVRVGEHEQYDRVVFDWPRAVTYKITRDGSHVTLRFAAPGNVKLSPTSQLSRAIHFASSKDTSGNLIVAFDVNAKSTTKDFFNAASIAIDVFGKPVSAQAKEPIKETPKPVPPVAPAAASQPAVTQVTPTPVPVVTPAPAPQVAAAPATVTVPVQQPAPVPTPVAANVVTPPLAPLEEKPTAPQMPEVPPPATPTVAPVDAKAKDLPKLNIGTKPVLVASLDPHTPLRAAIWSRGGYGTILFDRKLTLSAEALSQGSAPPAVSLQPLDLPAVSGFRFAIPQDVELHATREGTIWRIYLTKQQSDVPVSASLVAQPDFALGARFILPLPDAPDPIRFIDPVVGDELVVVPLNQTQAFSVQRRMADFIVLPAAQGLVLHPLRDKLIVRTVSDGVEITADGGLHLSKSTDTGASQQSAQKARSAGAGKSLFDFATWRGKSDESFTKARQRLQQTIVDVPDRERNRTRLELVRFYFARGYGPEALALINYLTKEVPDLSTHTDFLALSGATKILSNRPEEGLKDLDAANMPDQPEIKLWQAVGMAQTRDWVDAEDKFASSEALLTGYPEPFYSHFFVLAIEAAIAVGNNREAADWLDTLQSNPHNGEVDPAIEYLRGVLHAKSGRAQAAATAWKEVAASNDRLYRVRAELALIDLGVANQSLTPAQAADRLEALRFAWRGDDLEADILNRLGQFYVKAKNVKAGLGMWGQALQLYPKSPIAPKIHDEMSETFRDVFLGELGKKLSPLEALTLYQQYRDTLMPSGDDGVAVTRNLAERLTAIDLMDQAGDLLEDIATHKLIGLEKARVVSRLAAIRLIDHKPQAALDALDLTAKDEMPVAIQKERSLLHAKALAELHREDEALALLKDDTRQPARVLRADINIRAQHWDEAAQNLLDLVGAPPRAGVNLSEQQADWLVRCAIAMAMAGDQVGLDKLAIDYGAPMAGTKQNNTFRILVQPDKQGQLKDISAAQSRISDVDMFQSFLDSYRSSDSGIGEKK